MKRRNFLSLPILAVVATPAVDALARLWPFEPVEWLYWPAGVASRDPGDAAWRFCDICYGTPLDDFGNGLPEPRQFYRTTDGYDLCVCEHCTAAYLAENFQ